ncbi:MAG: ParA family protein [Bacilli bacterium]|nr:ParA family protein [Bacilli bacterium]
MAKIISVSGQKGGCGKSTVTMILASTLAYKYAKKVIVVDADTQHSITNIRRRNLELIKPYETGEVDENGEKILDVDNYDIYNEFNSKNIPAYPVVKAKLDADEILNIFDKTFDEYEYILLDLPGNVDSDAYFEIIQNADVVFVPFIVNPLDFDSNFPFVKLLHDELLGKDNTRLKSMYYFWNKFDVKSKARQDLFEEMNKSLHDAMPNIVELDNKITDTKTVINPRLMNTLVAPMSPQSSYGNMGVTIEEMCDKVL